jgi:hypothetical protein
MVSPTGVYQGGTGSDVAPSMLSQSNSFLSGRFPLDYKNLTQCVGLAQSGLHHDHRLKITCSRHNIAEKLQQIPIF